MAKRFKKANINEILPKEMFMIIFKNLGYKRLSSAKGTCKYWHKLIDDFKILERASRKFQHFKYGPV